MPATLRSLRIRNLALVESLDWELASGFSVVTGETGAGKSVIVGALKLVLGERADKSLIRTGAEQCSVEALFELDEVAEMNQLLGEQGIDAVRRRSAFTEANLFGFGRQSAIHQRIADDSGGAEAGRRWTGRPAWSP